MMSVLSRSGTWSFLSCSLYLAYQTLLHHVLLNLLLRALLRLDLCYNLLFSGLFYPVPLLAELYRVPLIGLSHGTWTVSSVLIHHLH